MGNQSKILKYIGKFSKHYENFPVSSFLIPRKHQVKIKTIYWFARTADDIADEGNTNAEIRMELLNQFENEFILSLNQKSNLSYMNLLGQIIKHDDLTSEYFLMLLSAFKQDIIKKRYNSFNEILDYCNRSANPVGRLVLEVFNYCSNEMNILSDKICTSLQLINFIQDTKIDIDRDRLYYPIDEIKNLDLSESDFFNLKFTPSIKEYIKFNVNRAQALMNEGKSLIKFLKGRFAVEIKWTILGGLEILKKIEKSDYNVMAIRPTISKFDYSKIFIRSLFNL